MLELEENSKLLQTLEQKLKDLGDSLWHCKNAKKVGRIRKTNNGTKLLGRYPKINTSIRSNKKNKK